MTTDTDALERLATLLIAPLRDQFSAVSKDAREARDGMREIRATLTSQDVGKQIDGLRNDQKDQHAALRQDVVVAIGNVKIDITAVSERVKDLEDDKEQRTGGLLALKFMRDYGGWFVGIGAAAFMAFEKLAK